MISGPNGLPKHDPICPFIQNIANVFKTDIQIYINYLIYNNSES